MRNEAKARGVLDRLVRRPVFAKADGIVREDVNDVRAHDGGQADGIARVIGKDEECAAVGYEAAVDREAVHHGAHAELAHAVEHIVAAAFAPHCLGGLGHGQVGAGEVRRAADELGQRGHEHVEREL